METLKHMKYKLLLILIPTLFLSLKLPINQLIGDKKTKIFQTSTYNVYVIKKGEMNFKVSESKPTNSDFYINSNFFTKSGNPIGLVVIDGKRKNRRVKGGGFFYVKNGKPYVRSKNSPKMTQHSSQTILWGIDNGIMNVRLFTMNHANLKRHRTLMGQTRDGDIVVVSSRIVGRVTIKEIVTFSSKYDIVDGILLDGGTSVDYKFTDKNGTTSVMSVPLGLKGPLNIKEPTTYITGNFN